MIGEVLGNRYELVEKIGEGGMAIVYKARDNKLSRLVAVKVLKKEFANNKDISDKFKKEATAVANFSDANIVNVLDVGHEEEGNIDYFVMEYVNGKTLKELIVGSGKLNYTTAISIAIQIAKALECAHKNNIIHRDVKPQNILVTESGLIKVTDFGIAKSSTSATITNTTTIMGSAHYLSPEQAKGSFVDLRSDIYSLGVVLYEMVTGVLPFDGESPVTIALKHIQSEPIEPKKQNQAIPDSLNNLIMKCMSKECINRYQNCKELIDDLQKIKENPNVSIGTVENYDDGKTIIMEPIRVEDFVKNESSKNTSEESKNKIYTRDDFENDYYTAYPLYRLGGAYLDFEKLFDLGIDGLIHEIDSQPLNSFLRACKKSLIYLKELIKLYRDDVMDINPELAYTLNELLEHRPQNMKEAIQLMWIYVGVSEIRNYGRMDNQLARFLDDEQDAYKNIAEYFKVIRQRNTIYNGRIILGGEGLILFTFNW